MGEKRDAGEVFLGIINENWLTQYWMRAITNKCYGLRATFPLWMASERVSEQQSCEGPNKRRALTFLLCTLLSRLVSLATCEWLLSEKLLAGCYGFHFSEGWWHRHRNSSLTSKRTHTPKSICHLLTSLLALDIWAEKLLKLSSLAKPVNSNHFCEIYLQLSGEIVPFLGKKQSFPETSA